MLRIQMIGLAVVAAVMMSAVAASSAFAAHEWLINKAPIAAATKVQSEGLLLLADTTIPAFLGGETKVHCHGFDAGTVGPGALDLVEKITADRAGTNDKVTCNLDVNGGCQGTTATALAINLPWHTELYLEGAEERDMITSDGAGEPGWRITCKTALGETTDECKNSLGSTSVTNVTGGGVDTTFDGKSQKANCKIGAEGSRTGAGKVEGVVLQENPSSTELLSAI